MTEQTRPSEPDLAQKLSDVVADHLAELGLPGVVHYPDKPQESLRVALNRLCSTLQARIDREVESWRKLTATAPTCEPPIVRQQFPDGSVPEDLRECAEGWKRHYERMLADWQTMKEQRDEAREESAKHWNWWNEATKAKSQTSTQSPPEVIEGRGQVVTLPDPVWELRDGDDEVLKWNSSAHSATRYDYYWINLRSLRCHYVGDNAHSSCISSAITVNTLDEAKRICWEHYLSELGVPSRPTFTPPPKPELMLVRYKDCEVHYVLQCDDKRFLMTQNGRLLKAELCVEIDETTGEVTTSTAKE